MDSHHVQPFSEDQYSQHSLLEVLSSLTYECLRTFLIIHLPLATKIYSHHGTDVRSLTFDLRPSKSNQFTLEIKWMFVPNLKTFSQGVGDVTFTVRPVGMKTECDHLETVWQSDEPRRSLSFPHRRLLSCCCRQINSKYIFTEISYQVIEVKQIYCLSTVIIWLIICFSMLMFYGPVVDV